MQPSPGSAVYGVGMPRTAGPGTVAPDRGIDPRVGSTVVDVLVYVVVLNLFVEYFPRVISESFSLSLLTAALLKVVLDVVIAIKNRIKIRFKAAPTAAGKILAGALLWVVLFGSKFLVLELVDLVFGDRVSLGGLVSVTLLVISLVLAQAAVRRLLYDRRALD